MDTHVIANYAWKCLQAFEKGETILSVEVGPRRSNLASLDFKSDFEQFRVWTKNLGVFARDTASVDYRLRDAWDVRKSICSLLDALHTGVSQCVELIRTEKATLHPIDIATLREVSSESASDDDDEEKEEKELSAASQVRFLLENTGELVEKLIRISVAIRKSGLKARNLKADAWEDKGEDGLDEADLFEKSLRLILEKRYGLTDPLKWRICVAVSRQKHRLKFWRAHQERLSFGKGFEQADQERRLHVPPQPLFETSENHPEIKESDKTVRSLATGLTQNTEATKFTKIKMDPRTLAPGAPVSTISSNFYALQATIPKPPFMKPGMKYFQCPYCCILLPRDIADSLTRWRHHVISDLCPFICVDISCTATTVQFERESEWFEHHKKYHAQEWWCDGSNPPHEPQVFHDAGTFANHVRTSHNSEYPETRIQRLVQMSGSSAEDPFQACPFCDAKSLNIESHSHRNNGIAQKWRGHIANHLIDLFVTFALPQQDDLDDQMSDRTINSLKRSTIGQLDSSEYDITTGSLTPKTAENELEDQNVEDRDDFEYQWDFVPTLQLAGSDSVLSAFLAGLERIHFDVEAIQRVQQHRQHSAITNWLSSTDFATQQSDLISRRENGTGLWFINSPQFLSWLHGSNETLFCTGIPGTGKTMITAIAVDHLWKHVQTKDIGVAYIYCNYRLRAEQTATNLAATILKQLVQQRPSIGEHVENLYDRYSNKGLRPSIREIISALQTVVSIHSRVYVLIDALDECSDTNGYRSQLLVMLRDLHSQGNLNLMVTSRHIPEIMQHFSLSPALEVQASDFDVKRFVAGQIYRLPKCVQRDDELQKAIEDGISVAADGMFLLAYLHVDSLLDKSTKKQVLSTLGEFPRGSSALEEAYNSAIKRIEDQVPGRRTLARTVLSWITQAQRPLTTGELCHALAVESGSSELDPNNIPDVEDMVSVCAGLVTIDDESNIIRLVHYTTQEYFERIRESWNPRAQQDIASACLTYLSFETFVSGACSTDTDFKARLAENVFFEYAAKHWAHHVLTVQQEVSQLALQFLQNEALVASASQIMVNTRYSQPGYSQKFLETGTGLHITAKYGLVFLLAELLHMPSAEAIIEADSKDNYGGTPLSYAAAYGHETVVELLMERDDVIADSRDIDGRTPLAWAAANGHEAVVKLLMERDDVIADSRDVDGRTPLAWAAANGHEAVLKLLVERDDVIVDSRDVDGRTPLAWAAANGHEAVVKLLMERDDVDTNSRNNDGRTPLAWAAANGHEAVLKLLVERDDVIVDSRDVDGRTPLVWAAANGHEAVVKLLIERASTQARRVSEDMVERERKREVILRM